MRVIPAAALLMAISNAQAMSFVAVCPASISVKEKATSTLDGWAELTSSSPRNYSNLAVFSGHPSELASLKPDDEEANPAVWSFPGGSENNWIACRYRQTGVEFARQVPNGMSRCVLAYRVDGGRLMADWKISCE